MRSGAPAFVRKSNSTTTFFLESSLFEPERNDMIFSMSFAVFSHLTARPRIGPPRTETDVGGDGHPLFQKEFDEVRHKPLENPRTRRYRTATGSTPDLQTVYSFVSKIMDRTDLEETVLITTLALVERLMRDQCIVLQPCNWRRIVFTAFLVSTKVFYDEVVWNADFKQSFPAFDLKNLHEMEVMFLDCIDYRTTVHKALYAKYYFELRNISEQQKYAKQKEDYDMTMHSGWRSKRVRPPRPPSTMQIEDIRQDLTYDGGGKGFRITRRNSDTNCLDLDFGKQIVSPAENSPLHNYGM